tara:strand:- start:573 stop:1214 length:642 start_codon:yes stop_codon:yes gene_type:complete
MFHLGVIIPSKNEFGSLRKIVKKLQKKKVKFIIINDGSTDNTDEYLVKNKINHIKNRVSVGYTKSILKGILYFKSKNIKYILTMDADGEHDINYLKKFKEKLKKNNYDLIVANRYHKNRISEKIISFFTKKRFNIEDPLSGFKLYKLKTILKNFKYIKNNNFFVDYMAFLLKKNYQVVNINYKNSKLINRKSRIGNKFIINFRIMSMLRFFYN